MRNMGFKDKSWLVVRPSETESKIKVYFSTVEKTEINSKLKIKFVK